MTTKTCTKCNEAKATTEFYKSERYKCGFRPACKTCTNIGAKGWYKRNSADHYATTRAWHKANPDHRAALVGKNNAKGRYPDCIPNSFDLVSTLPIYAEARKLSDDTGVPHQVDHIKPLLYGGLHEASNLQVITAAQNLQKKTTDKEIYG